MKEFEAFKKRAEECKNAILKMTNPIVVTHYDCDGLCAGAIVCKFLEDNSIDYKIKIVRRLDDELIETLKKEEEIIFSDLGGGSKKVNELKANVVIFDHHQTEGVEKLQLNPHLFGMDGGFELSGATCTYFALEKLPEVAIVGAIGDMQYPFRGLNKKLLEKFQKEKIVQEKIDLKIYGRMSRPLPQLLAYSDEPYFPGLANNEERCIQFLESNNIKRFDNRWPTYYELDEDSKKRLIGALASYLTEYYKKKIEPSYLVGPVYDLIRFKDIPELFDAGEFSTMLNACGRHKKEMVGLKICMNKLEYLEEGKRILNAHRRALREGIDYAYKNVNDLGSFLFLDARGIIEDGIIGVVAGMLLGAAYNKPIIAMALDEKNNVKISARAPAVLVKKGLNLGLILKTVSEEVGGVGGGHKIAAGATIPTNKINEILELFEKELKKLKIN
ncbi:MAG: DHH family phosphoesterase [Candidatus Micrarchaeota archaeon]|nr:DHH family phosphoesterase [Candidatus Micrarchaeota archaeon]